MSDNESISTEDMNALLETTNDFVEEEPEKRGVERTKREKPKSIKKKPEKSEPTVEELEAIDAEVLKEAEAQSQPEKPKRQRTQKQIEATKRMVEARKKKAAEIKANKAQEPEKPKNKVGRPTTTIIKEKIIYMAPQADGSYAPMKMKKPTAREIKAFDNEQEVKAKEDETNIKNK